MPRVRLIQRDMDNCKYLTSIMVPLITGGNMPTVAASVVVEESLYIAACHSKMILTKIADYSIFVKVQDVGVLVEVLDKLASYEVHSGVPQGVLGAVDLLF